MIVDIIGRSVRTPSAANVDELFDLLKDGRCAVTSVPRDRWSMARFWHPVPGTPGKAYTFAAGVIDDIHSFDPAVFGLTAREAMYMDPQQKLLLQLVWRALEDAALDPADFQKQRVGVYVGASSLDSGNTYIEDPASGSPYFMTGNTLSIIANRISHVFGLNGPSLTIDTACSSSLVALDQAVRALQTGEIDTAIVGGVNILAHPFSFIGFSQARMLSPEGLCRAYGENGEGYVRSEGGGVVILRASEHAAANGDRSYASIRATGLNSAGRTNGISLPSRESQAQLLKSIYDQNGLDPNDLAFIEGHGTGTKVGDPAELWAIGTELGARRAEKLLIGSVKTNVGHSEPASGMFGLIKAMLSLQHDFLTASLHAETLNSEISFDELNIEVNREGRTLPRGNAKRLAGINSFGFGGTNAHVVISDPAPYIEKAAPSTNIFMVSAQSESALHALLESYEDELRSDREDLKELVAVSAHNRAHHKYRFAVDSVEPDTVRKGIADHLSGKAGSAGHSGEVIGNDTRIAFVFSGNGCQWAGMALDAYHNDQSFQLRFNHICSLFAKWLDADLVSLLQSPQLDIQLKDTRIGQALLFAIQAALSDILVERGVKPHAVFGHSVGEVAAAYCAGALSLEDAVAIVAVRSRHQHALAGEGKMAAVSLTPEKAIAFARSNGLDGVELGAINAHSAVTISGPADEIQLYRDKARKEHIPVHVLDIDYPFHHPIIDREKDGFLQELPVYNPGPETTAFISSVTGGVLSGAKLDAAYWWNNVRDIVRFSDSTSVALDHGCNLFIEIAPRAILQSYLAETARHKDVAIKSLPTLTRPARGTNPLPHIMAQAVAHGADAWRAADGASGRKAGVLLPQLPFERQHLQPAETSDKIDVFGRGDRVWPYTLLGWRADPNAAAWKNHIDAHLFPDLAEHVVDGKAILPGSAFIEIAVTAAQQFYDTSSVEVRNLEIIRPLELHANRLSELSTVLSPETGQVEIRSRDYLSEDEWTVHVVARARKPLSPPTKPKATPNEDASLQVVEAAAAYRTASLFGLDYGPAFRLLDRVDVAGGKTLFVDLAPAQPPKHPYVGYNLNPFSVDAAFHGLVALFADLTGEGGGAPYIPVRFGAVHVQSAGADIRRAKIDILRMSANTLRIRVELLDQEGNVVALLDDCRFRRTFLKVHQTLDTVSFHYEAVTHGVRSVASSLLPAILPQLESAPVGDLALLLDAAVYRACYDIAEVSIKLRLIASAELSAVPGLRAYVANCFLTLEDIGLAKAEGQSWTLVPDTDLPKMNDIVQEVLTSLPDSGAVAILINDAYRHTIKALAAIAAGEASQLPVYKASEATVEHLKNYAAVSRKRIETALATVSDYLETAASARSGLIIVEAGATSVSVSSRLAQLVDRYAASLVILEADENLRRTLEVALEGNPRVTVCSGENADLKSADLVFSASGFLTQSLTPQGEMGGALRAAAHAGAELFLIEHPSSALMDFVFGLQEDWFTEGALSDLPIGRMRTRENMTDLLSEIGFDAVTAQDIEFAEGSLVIVSGKGRGCAADLVQMNIRQSLLTLRVEDAPFLDLGAQRHVDLPWTQGLDQEAIDQVIREIGVDDLDVVYVMSYEPAENASTTVQDHVAIIGQLAEATRRAVDGRSDLRPRLTIIAPGGASVRDAEINAVNYAIWSFARVVQNEYDDIDIVLVDVAEGALSPKIWFELLTLQEKGETEFLLDIKTGLIQSVRVVAGPTPSTQTSVTEFAAATIVQKSAGRIETISWQAEQMPRPAPDEVVVEVAATGLNFRDVMWAMGLLPEEALEDGFAGATIGMEFSGIITAVGNEVHDLRVGDRVMGIGPKAFSTHVAVARMGVTRIPETIGTVEAATLPVTFLTAQYALSELANLHAGETVLIHGAAGGVGLAALQIAKAKRAIIIATAGSDEKRNLLIALGADHVFDSRSLDFFNDVMSVTNERGVDVVVNSLFSEAMERSIELVKPFGRFLELGKRDYYSDRKISLRPFRKNISYFGIDADQLLVDVPHVAEKIFNELSLLFRDGTLRPLPYRLFAYDEIPSAFRLMQSAGHIGKIVITPPRSGSDVVEPSANTSLSFSEGVYLVVGGIGGFGLQAADWLASKGATHIALATRSGKLDGETEGVMAEWAKSGITSSVHACNVTDEAALQNLLAELRGIGPLKGIIHAAMVLDDALICNLTRERNAPVIDTKVRGAVLLDRLTRKDPLDLFLLFSSATTMVGNPGQSNYVAANGFLEGLARQRRAEGLPALAVGFGAIADTGFLARNTDVSDVLSQRIGKNALKARDALRFTEEYFAASRHSPANASVMIAEIDWAAASNLKTVKTPVFSSIGLNNLRQQATDGDQLDLYAMVEGKSVPEVEDILHDLIAAELSFILKLAENNITSDKVLREIGLDSLMAMELGTSFQQKTGIDLPLSSISDTTTVGNIVGKLKDKLLSQRNGAPADEEEELLEALTSKHLTPNSTAA
ncbi:type I polyketide synthase [Agrobacterium larrymoorei]|uniref:Type I polyketide synthase n=1 Tax=Agrobacterium larrymoorei TaxID=160699 RepID=A0AAF0HBF5_9HYPH|nr:type I polyketide synthase [Agrobacterium larrymoorei]WHA42592.1 type I polyketide synthase [Agrobacterium larrymoorei]